MNGRERKPRQKKNEISLLGLAILFYSFNLLFGNVSFCPSTMNLLPSEVLLRTLILTEIINFSRKKSP